MLHTLQILKGGLGFINHLDGAGWANILGLGTQACFLGRVGLFANGDTTVFMVEPKIVRSNFSTNDAANTAVIHKKIPGNPYVLFARRHAQRIHCRKSVKRIWPV
jgi:hypothetical protein